MEDRPSPFQHGVPRMSLAREAAFVSIIGCGQLFTQAGLALSLVPLHVIGESLGVTNAGELSWIIAAYSLTVGIFVLPSGRLGDMYGHKLMFLLGFAWYGLFSILGGFAIYTKSAIYMDVMRALQGIGPATILPNAVALLGRTYKPGHRKNFVFSLFAATAPNGWLIGGLFTALLTERVWWPWAFWIMGIACFVVTILAVFIIPSPDDEEVSEKSLQADVVSVHSKPGFDYLGTATGLTGLILVNFALNQAPVVGWSNPYTYVLLIVGILFICLFLWVETIVDFPLVPQNVWTRSTSLMLACISLGWASFGIWSFYLTQLFQVIRLQSPLSTVANFVPCGISGALASVATAFLIPHIGAPNVMVVAMSAFCIALILCGTIQPHQTYWANAVVAIVVAPFGMDASFPAASIVMSNSVPRHEQGVAASLVNTFINYSISIGLGLAGSVETHVDRNGTDIFKGYQGAFYLGIGMSGLGIILAVVNVLLDRRQHKSGNEDTNKGTNEH